jgi:glutamyl-Q tRNA(Asp) synthetase
MHLGHVLNAAYVWSAARELGGRVLLRIEDHDRVRCKPEYEIGILDDLDGLALTPDVYPTACFRAGRCDGRQTDRDPVYADAARDLIARGLVYACACSRRTITAAGTLVGGEWRYPGTCRDRGLPLTTGYGWRVRTDPETIAFDDLQLGRQRQIPADQCGDILIRDRIGNWTYQFAVTVDDVRQGIDLVVRGTDLLDSTGRQIYLGHLLGAAAPPAFLHHALIMKSADQKLSKSDADTGIRDLRAAGWTREQVLRAALHDRASDPPFPFSLSLFPCV